MYIFFWKTLTYFIFTYLLISPSSSSFFSIFLPYSRFALSIRLFVNFLFLFYIFCLSFFIVFVLFVFYFFFYVIFHCLFFFLTILIICFWWNFYFFFFLLVEIRLLLFCLLSFSIDFLTPLLYSFIACYFHSVFVSVLVFSI